MLNYFFLKLNISKIKKNIDEQRDSTSYKGDIEIPLSLTNKQSYQYINFIYRFHLTDVKLIVKNSTPILKFKAYPLNLVFFNPRELSKTTLESALSLEEDFLQMELDSLLGKRDHLSSTVNNILNQEEFQTHEQDDEDNLIFIDFKEKRRLG